MSGAVPFDPAAVLQAIPYARFLGVRAERAGDEITLVLPYADHLIGNPAPAAIHGGVLGALMEMAAIAQLTMAQAGEANGLARRPRPIDITVEYLRSARPVDTFARAQLRRVGRRIANVHVEAWQHTRAAPVATLHGHFKVFSDG
ncbi:MAG: PaaI family thioesterase [Caulobacteraceae bacterium]